jgi:hypothetical protein
MAPVDDSVFNPFRDFMVDEMGRRSPTFSSTFAGYDGDPNLPAAPSLLDNAIPGTAYLRATPPTLYDKMALGAGNWIERGGGGGGAGSVTKEAFSVALDSVSGADPTTPLTIESQAESDAWGAFKTIPGAIDALPDEYKHMVTLQLTSGKWVLDSNSFGRTSRFRPTFDGWIRIAGASGWTQAAGSPASMAVQSHSAGVVTLQSDPGLAANTYKSYFLLVLSGTGAGQFKSIRFYSGAVITCNGTFSPGLDSTSVVQIVEANTSIELNDTLVRFDGRASHWALWQLEFYHVDIVPPSTSTWAYINTENVSYAITGGSRCVGVALWGGVTNIGLEDFAMDTRGWDWPGVVIQGGQVRTITGTSRPISFLGVNAAGHSAIQLLGAIGGNGGIGSGASLYMFGKHAFDEWAEAYVKIEYVGAIASINEGGGWYPVSDQSAPVAILILNGAQASVNDVSGFASSTFKGTAGDLDLDGIQITWAQLDADPDKAAMSTRSSAAMERLE